MCLLLSDSIFALDGCGDMYFKSLLTEYKCLINKICNLKYFFFFKNNYSQNMYDGKTMYDFFLQIYQQYQALSAIIYFLRYQIAIHS